MKTLAKRTKKKLTKCERERLFYEIVATVEAAIAIFVIGSILIATPICLIGGLVKLILNMM